MADLQAALGEIDITAPQRLRFDPASPLHDQFGRWPQDVAFDQAASLDMPSDWQRHQGDLATMLRAAMPPSTPEA
jgi:hypothetical protein